MRGPYMNGKLENAKAVLSKIHVFFDVRFVL